MTKKLVNDHIDTVCAGILGITGGSDGLAPSLNPATTFKGFIPGIQTGQSHQYSRDSGPGCGQTEDVISNLESGSATLLFASGMAAAISVFLALEPKSHVVIADDIYWAFKRWLMEQAPRLDLEVEFVPTGDLSTLKSALRQNETRLVWIETPSNPMWKITDIKEAAQIAHEAGAILCVDSTVSTPILTRPLELGADIVMHSATKYLNGHSDVLGGSLTCLHNNDFWAKIHTVRTQYGSILGSFESWLLLRGIRTLPVRVKASCQSALTIARHFENHPKIKNVLYPGLTSHIGHDIACQQMQGGFGGMLSIQVAEGSSEAARIAASTRLFHQATSLGGVESLIEHRAPVEGPTTKVPGDLLRLSVGVENVDDLIRDLESVL